MSMFDGAAGEALLDAAYQFLAAGGHPTLAEWVALSPVERAALGRAHGLLDIRRAQIAAQAAQGPEAVAELMGEIDDGDAVAHLLCETWAERAAVGLEPQRIHA